MTDLDPDLQKLVDQLRDLTITVTLDDEAQPPYWPSAVGATLSGALRQQSHGAWRVPILNAAIFDGDPPGSLVGPEEIAGIVFMGRRQAGENVTYDTVLAMVDAAGSCVVDFGGEESEEEPDSPPPSGRPSES